MRITIKNQLLAILLLAAVVFLSMRHASHKAEVCQKAAPASSEVRSTQLPWESLSRQFVSIQPY